MSRIGRIISVAVAFAILLIGTVLVFRAFLPKLPFGQRHVASFHYHDVSGVVCRHCGCFGHAS